MPLGIACLPVNVCQRGARGSDDPDLGVTVQQQGRPPLDLGVNLWPAVRKAQRLGLAQLERDRLVRARHRAAFARCGPSNRSYGPLFCTCNGTPARGVAGHTPAPCMDHTLATGLVAPEPCPSFPGCVPGRARLFLGPALYVTPLGISLECHRGPVIRRLSTAVGWPWIRLGFGWRSIELASLHRPWLERESTHTSAARRLGPCPEYPASSLSCPLRQRQYALPLHKAVVLVLEQCGHAVLGCVGVGEQVPPRARNLLRVVNVDLPCLGGPIYGRRHDAWDTLGHGIGRREIERLGCTDLKP